MQELKNRELPPNEALRDDERSSSLPQLVSPAQFLLDRVHAEEREQGCARKQTLIDLAKYILGSHGWSPAHTEIIKVLARYHLAKLANIHPLRRRKCWKLIALEEAKSYVARCMRCGLPIWNKTSLAAGHGPVCRKKLGISASRSGQDESVPEEWKKKEWKKIHRWG